LLAPYFSTFFSLLANAGKLGLFAGKLVFDDRKGCLLAFCWQMLANPFFCINHIDSENTGRYTNSMLAPYFSTFFSLLANAGKFGLFAGKLIFDDRKGCLLAFCWQMLANPFFCINHIDSENTGRYTNSRLAPYFSTFLHPPKNGKGENEKDCFIRSPACTVRSWHAWPGRPAHRLSSSARKTPHSAPSRSCFFQSAIWFEWTVLT